MKLTFSPLARLIALSGLSTRETRRIFTTEIVSILKGNSYNHICYSVYWATTHNTNWNYRQVSCIKLHKDLLNT